MQTLNPHSEELMKEHKQIICIMKHFFPSCFCFCLWFWLLGVVFFCCWFLFWLFSFFRSKGLERLFLYYRSCNFNTALSFGRLPTRKTLRHCSLSREWQWNWARVWSTHLMRNNWGCLAWRKGGSGGCSEEGLIFSLRQQVTGQEETASACARKDLDWMLGNISSQKGL